MQKSVHVTHTKLEININLNNLNKKIIEYSNKLLYCRAY